MKRLFVYLFLLFVLSSCNDNSGPLTHFDKTIQLTSSKTVDLEDYDILNPWLIVISRGRIGLFEGATNTGCIALIDKSFDHIYRGLSKGQGPNEISNGVPRLYVLADSLYYVDVNYRRSMKLDVQNDSLKVVRVDPFNCFCSCSSLLGDNKALAINYDTAGFLNIVDYKKGRALSSIPFPENTVLSGFDEQVQRSIYMNTCVANSPDATKFAYGVCYSEQYGFGRIEHDSLLIDKGYVYSDMKILDIIDGYILPADDSRANATDAIGTDNHAVFLYSGAGYESDETSIGKDVLVYSWNGTPVVRLVLDKKVNSIAYDKDRKKLLCLSHIPESLYIEYDLNGIIDL